MKNLLLVLLSTFGFSNLYTQTTMEEFRYLTKEYEQECRNGQPVKRGYYLVKYHEFELLNEDYSRPIRRKNTFYALMRSGERQPCAILMMIQRFDTDFKEYICIPHYYSHPEVWEAAKQHFDRMGSTSNNKWPSAARNYMWNSLRMISFMALDYKSGT